MALAESLEDESSLGGDGGMNCVAAEELESVVLELALVDELLLVDELALVCSNCMRIERLDPPTPLTDMPNSRVEGTGPAEHELPYRAGRR